MELANDSNDTWIIAALLEEVRRDWLNVSDELRPSSAWICYCAVLNENGNSPNPSDTLLRVWHLDNAGIHERDVWSFLRFKAVKTDRLWDRASLNRVAADRGFGMRHEIGIAQFGRLAESADWNLDYR